MASKIPTTPAEWMERFAPSAERLAKLAKVATDKTVHPDAQAIIRKFIKAHS